MILIWVCTTVLCQREHRIKTEKLFLENKIDAIICTSSLELGIDFDNVDQVINIGTPKALID